MNEKKIKKEKKREDGETRQEASDKLERTDTGFSLSVETKRGTGTRDQDKVVGKLKTETLSEAEAQREDLMKLVKKTAEDARKVLNEEDDGENGGEK